MLRLNACDFTTTTGKVDLPNLTGTYGIIQVTGGTQGKTSGLPISVGTGWYVFYTSDTNISFSFTGSATESANTVLIEKEAIQDAIGGMLVDSSDIDFTYNDASGTITAVLKASGLLSNYALSSNVATSLGLKADKNLSNISDSDFYDKQLDALVNNKKIRGLIGFAYNNNLIWDLKFHNMGTIGDRVVMVDYGLLGMGRTK